VDVFLSGAQGPPSLTPLRIYWDVVKSPWNTQLAASFAEYFVQKRAQWTGDREELAAYFIQRIETMRKILLTGLARDGETDEEVLTCMTVRKQRIIKQSRIRGRQSRVGSLVFLVYMSWHIYDDL
jgi:hypothetical protein